jgi:RNA polymerase sigma-70 factor (ECF subfamily)
MDPGRHDLENGDLPTIPDYPGWPDEASLLEGLKAGDERAYESLVSKLQTPVYNLVLRLIDDQNEASDVTQDVFLKVFRNVSAFRGQSSLKTWVYRIAVNEAHNRRRWFGRHRRPEVGIELDDSGRGYLDIVSDPGRSPYDLVLNQEFQSAIERALAELNPVFRSAVVLRDLEDLSYEEIADVLDVSLGTVKSRILRGRECLRKTLMEQLEPERAMGFTPQPAD